MSRRAFLRHLPELPVQLLCLAVSAAAMSTATTGVSAAAAAAVAAATTAARVAASAARGATAAAATIAARRCTTVAAAAAGRIGSAAHTYSPATVAIRIPAMAAVCIPAVAAIAVTAMTVATVAVAAMTIPAVVIPGSGADEHAAIKPARAVIPVGGAAIGGVRVVAPLAVRGAVIHGRTHNRRADTNSNRHLGIGRCRKRQSQKHRYQNQSHIPHDILHVLPAVPVSGTLEPESNSVFSTRRFLFPTGFCSFKQQPRL